MLVEGNVLAIRAGLFLLQGVAAALVAFVVDLGGMLALASRWRAGPTFASSRFLIVFSMGFMASLASFAGMMSLRSMSLTVTLVPAVT